MRQTDRQSESVCVCVCVCACVRDVGNLLGLCINL